MSATGPDEATTALKRTRELGRKLGLCIFVPCIVVSFIGILVGLANLEGDGPAFLIGSVAALAGSVFLFIAARRGSGLVFLITGGLIILVCLAFAVFLVWTAVMRTPDALRSLIMPFAGALFGFALARSGLDIVRSESAQRETAKARNPFAELGSSPAREGERVE